MNQGVCFKGKPHLGLWSKNHMVSKTDDIVQISILSSIFQCTKLPSHHGAPTATFTIMMALTKHSGCLVWNKQNKWKVLTLLSMTSLANLKSSNNTNLCPFCYYFKIFSKKHFWSYNWKLQLGSAFFFDVDSQLSLWLSWSTYIWTWFLFFNESSHSCSVWAEG
jgi:hypothetical protein